MCVRLNEQRLFLAFYRAYICLAYQLRLFRERDLFNARRY